MGVSAAQARLLLLTARGNLKPQENNEISNSLLNTKRDCPYYFVDNLFYFLRLFLTMMK